jgi:hypothetical protein
MAFFELPISLKFTNGIPTDTRMVADDQASREDIVTVGVHWEGMFVYQLDNKKTYQLKGITNGDWEEIGGGVSDAWLVNYDDTITQLGANNVQEAIEKLVDIFNLDVLPYIHNQNTDTKLAEGTADEVTANDIRTHLDDTNIHTPLDDNSTANDHVWSAAKIIQELGSVDSSSWEADGVGKIRPKNGDKVDAIHIDNLPAGYDSINFSNDFNTKTTDDLIEGLTNKYTTGDEFQKTTDTLDDIIAGVTNFHLTDILKTDYDDAVTKRHDQNTDTSTTSYTFNLDTANSGNSIESDSEKINVRNHDQTEYRDIQVRHIFKEYKTKAVNITGVANIDLTDADIVIATLTDDITGISFSPNVDYKTVDVYLVKSVTRNLKFADTYAPSVSYTVGDNAIYNNVVYRCTNNTTGTFEPNDWGVYIKFIDNVIPIISPDDITDVLTVMYNGTYFTINTAYNV